SSFVYGSDGQNCCAGGRKRVGARSISNLRTRTGWRHLRRPQIKSAMGSVARRSALPENRRLARAGKSRKINAAMDPKKFFANLKRRNVYKVVLVTCDRIRR